MLSKIRRIAPVDPGLIDASDDATNFHKTQLMSKLDKLYKTLEEESLGIPIEARRDEITLRPLLIEALLAWGKSSFVMGRILCEYREAYRSSGDRTWGVAENAIASAVGCNPKTLRRLLGRYRQAARLPRTVLNAMEAAGLPPIKATSSEIVTNLLHLIRSNPAPDENEAAELVARANASDPRSDYVRLTREQRRLWQDRVAIGKMLSRCTAGNRLSDLIKALEQELFHAWGETEPRDVRIVPCPGPFTIDGLVKAGSVRSDDCIADSAEVA